MKALAIDQGTTSTRAFVVDGTGIRPVHAVSHRQIHPAPGRVEHDPEEILANIRACLAAAPAVDCAGLDNQGESCLAWDARTGEAISPVIVWQDDRTARTCADLARAGVDVLVRERAGLPLDPYFAGSKLGWIMAHVPRARDLARSGHLRLGTTDAFFRDRLTGRFETDPTTASRTALMDLRRRVWDAELCAAFGVPMAALPPIRATTGALGLLPGGIPLTASVVDQQAALHGHGARRPGDAKITFGTGAFALTLTGELAESATLLPTIAWEEGGAAPVHALDGGVYTAASAVNWARGIGLFGTWDEIGDFAAPPAISRGLAFVPALAGLAAPHWDRGTRGAWFGLELGTTRADMMQALLEGVAFRMTEVVDAMARAVPVRAPVSIDGGMSRNPWFCRFLADVLGQELRIPAESELTALGCGQLALRGAGLPEGAGHVPAGRIITPRPIPQEWTARFRAAREAVRAYGAHQPAPGG
ncbi:MAG: glycerol kinase [Rubellimicrobium sp.]|nr:glycerol kinase [Rubellimicrobium sp.]